MESDKQFYEIFETNPQWIFELIGRPSPGPCQFASITVKAIERRCDGVLLPEDIAQPVLVTEFQMQADQGIYNRIVIEMALIKGEQGERKVEGLIIFGSRDLDVKTEPWCRVISVRYLDELLEQLTRRCPTHPLVAVFQPLIEPDRDLLEMRAGAYYNQIKASTSEPRQKEKLLAVFVNWLVQRFDGCGLKEIEKMLIGKMPHLRDTQAGRDLIAIGVQEGIELGIEKGIEKGIEQGIEKGIEQGIEKGIEQGIEKGIEQGIEKGIEKGSFIGTILTCQRFLGLLPSERSVLEAQSTEVLQKLAEQLQDAVVKRLGNQ